MKKWISILLMSVVLCACGKAEESPEKVGHKPDVVVKVKPPVDKKKSEETKKIAKKEKHITKQKDEKNNTTATTSKSVQSSGSYDTERYNLARTCLVIPGKVKEADCQEISHTSEYSKAWNNLTSEGYICRSGHCNLTAQTEKKSVENQEKVTNEKTSTVPITTEVIPAKPSKTTEPETTEPTTEIPATTETDEARTIELKTTEQANTLTKESSTQQPRTTVQEDNDDNNQ